jgi:LacI family transcriptional regulator
MPKPGPTIQEVARVAGVSPASVSRFLNGRLNLPEATARRIEAAVLELGYRPNAIARRLRSGSSETLGLITADIAYPLFASIASAAEAEATEAGYSLVMFNSRNRAESEIGFLSRVEDRQLDGMLLLTNHIDDGRLAARINASKAVVLLDEDVPGAEAPRLFADNEAGGLAAGRHLLAAGHRRIAHVTGPAGLLSVDERRRGFEAALAEAGLTLAPELVMSGRYDESFGAEAFQRLFALAEPPTAVFAAADMLAIGMIRAARAAGVSVPRDLSIVGYDDIPLASLLDPPLTTIRQAAEAFGRLGVRLLVELVRGRATAGRPERIPVELVVRGSVDRPRAGVMAAPARKRPGRAGGGV